MEHAEQFDTGAAGGGVQARLERLGRELFYVDLRSVAALRIALGILIIADRITRSFHFQAHYTDLGGAPRDVILDQFGWSAYCSIHWWMAGSTVTEAAVFVLTCLLAAGLVAGWKTRFMTIACWYMQASLLARLPLLHTGGDRTLLLMLFWLILLPAGARWSVDAARRAGVAAGSNRYVSLAGFGILIQVCVIYWVAVVLKLTSPMWVEGRAVEFALTRDAYATGWAQWLLQFETLLPVMTLAVLAWELLGPFLAFVPGFTTPGRLIAVAGFWLLHFGFGMCLMLDIFWVISCAAWLVFLPSAFWDRVVPASATSPEAPRLRAAIWQTAAAAVALAFMVVLNVRSLPGGKRIVPGVVARIGYALRLRQDWGMFTHEKRATTGWFLAHAVLADGREVDLLPEGEGVPFTWERPDSVAGKYGSARWAQFLYWYPSMADSPYWEPYCAYLCRRWNDAHPPGERAERVTIWFMLRRKDLFGDENVQRLLLHEHACTTPPA